MVPCVARPERNNRLRSFTLLLYSYLRAYGWQSIVDRKAFTLHCPIFLVPTDWGEYKEEHEICGRCGRRSEGGGASSAGSSSEQGRQPPLLRQLDQHARVGQ